MLVHLAIVRSFTLLYSIMNKIYHNLSIHSILGGRGYRSCLFAIMNSASMNILVLLAKCVCVCVCVCWVYIWGWSC